MHKQSNVKASSAVKTLMALSEGGHDEHLLSAVANVHISVFKNLCLGLSRRASERKEIGLQARRPPPCPAPPARPRRARIWGAPAESRQEPCGV